MDERKIIDIVIICGWAAFRRWSILSCLFHQHEHVGLLLFIQVSAFVHQFGDAGGQGRLRSAVFRHAVVGLRARRKIYLCLKLLIHQTLEIVDYLLLLVDLCQLWNDSNHRLMLVIELHFSPFFADYVASCLSFTEFSEVSILIKHSAIVGMKKTAYFLNYLRWK